eukprot:421788_1
MGSSTGSLNMEPFMDETYNNMEENKYPSNAKHSQDQRFKIVVGIDFGTDGSTLAYAIPDEEGNTTVYIHNLWKDVPSTEKPKTSILFDNEGNVQCTGDSCVNLYINVIERKGWKLFDRFKMSLYEDNAGKNKTGDIKEKIRATNGNIEEY